MGGEEWWVFTPSKFLSRENDRYNRTPNEPYSSMSVDIGPTRKMIVNHYCLRSDGMGDYCPLRNWKLEGSSDSTTWTTLRTHTNDTELAEEEYSVAHWEVNGSQTAFRYFRIIGGERDTNPYTWEAAVAERLRTGCGWGR